MSASVNKIELNRRRIALAYLDFCQRHFYGKWVNVVLESKARVRVEITQQSIEHCMLTLIEQPGYEEFGRLAGESNITTLYTGMLNRDASKLTPLGVTVLEEMMLAAVTDALQHPEKNTLQVVH